MSSFAFTVTIFNRRISVKGSTSEYNIDIIELFGWCICKDMPIWYAE